MVETTKGSELAKVTIIDNNFYTVYDEYVKPTNPVKDLRTDTSGIT
jgi:hypothetical protein